MWPVCGKMVKIGEGGGKPTQGNTFSAEHEPVEDRAFAEGQESAQSLGSARMEGIARRPV